MSALAAVYANIAALSVAAGSSTPLVYGPASLPKTLDTVQTPCRVLDPSYNPQGDGGRFEILPHGGPLGDVHWTITDVLLYKAQGQGIGPLAVASDLVAYCAAYVEVARQNRAIGGTSAQCDLQLVEPRIRFDLEWPLGTGRFFYGVVVTLTVYEALSG